MEELGGLDAMAGKSLSLWLHLFFPGIERPLSERTQKLRATNQVHCTRWTFTVAKS